MIKLYNNYVFPYILDRVMQLPSLMTVRQSLLAPITGHVVEVGFGTGLNLPFYRDIEQLTTIDPNQGLHKLAESRLKSAPFLVEHLQLSAEKMPLADHSVDAVVSTWTLCSIADVEGALLEIYRILKPNGVFHFVEHGLNPQPHIARWQRRLTPIQKRVADGCHLDRDIQQLVQNAGFNLIEQQSFYAESVPQIGHYMMMGRAQKKQSIS